MKLLNLFLVLMGVCFNNNYAMQNQDLAEKLSKANDLIKNAEDIIEAINNNFSRSIVTMPIDYAEKTIEYRAIAANCADLADNLLQSVLKHKAVTDSMKNDAKLSQQRIALFKKEAS